MALIYVHIILEGKLKTFLRYTVKGGLVVINSYEDLKQEGGHN